MVGSILAVKVAPSFTVKPGLRIISLPESKLRFAEGSTVVGPTPETVILILAFSVLVVVIVWLSIGFFSFTIVLGSIVAEGLDDW